jgi:hypothetical protein
MQSLGPTLTNVPGQLYSLISFVGPECPQKNDKFGLKIYGNFETIEIAKEHAKKLQAEDATFDILVAQTNNWLLIPPDKKSIEDTHYVEEKLEEIMQEMKTNRRQAASMFEKRKRDLMVKPLENSDTPYIDPSDEFSKYYNKPDVPPITHPSEYLTELKDKFVGAEEATLAKIAEFMVLAEIETRRQTPENPQTPPELLE